MSTETKKETPNKDAQKEKTLELAKQRGKITYDALLDILPEDASWEAMDELMVKLGGMNVDVVDEFRMDSETQQAQQKKEALTKKAVIRRDTTHSALERADDPVRMYLREMGRVPLLKKEQEVEIAKRIESAEKELTEVLLNTPYTLKEVQMLSARLLGGRLNLVQVSDIEELKDQ
ncbi:MAG: hypothetical protein NTU83_13745, partial [Candidatus Hydrogenedentes bacterium]|nr:hypothetical protein [Candidatus Hydrogenedentota bacterium]